MTGKLSLQADGSEIDVFPLTNWGKGISPSDFIGLCFPFGFYQIGLCEDDGWMVDGGWCI
ncbi:hypothetical protein GLOIN_2v1886485 [Rhizophagus irregularis DAOM 181602=DAOM 197198]|uniref:Uncharacterized protein n=1 Tax=Rhizophagus irregularis (strain DAOM 181602 / DAOM 197198 / MUCL 43194) TaxID=747089 RepID=A0A2P4NVD1_RHIID|nr:hypothetical protein GLOIN_2v1886485 [Rhizophagus irregularis DAOM 181602=DAOM 197198]POG57101.1 hypothetical protein GLOIN_2v1886485 [Rhizophagus irregularis DAOM 181602=DAOM 197198]|eukprot:XP_025164384.1 hypothetical protein GLOIN_2v1886485 [Rhizophagus irregularis DAOM 181602=DAOM 197198]